MNVKRITLEPAFVLHTRNYRDTSLLVDMLTMEHGRLTVVARGVRSKKSRLQGILVPFLPLLISYSGKGDLCTLQRAEIDGANISFTGDLLVSGFYLNELLVKLVPRQESYEEVYHAYKKTLSSLINSKLPEVELRLFEKCLLKNLGYGLELDRTVSGEGVLENKCYAFEFGVGINQVDSSCPGNFSGKSLLALHKNILIAKEEITDAKRLLRKVLAILLGGKTLKSREMFYK